MSVHDFQQVIGEVGFSVQKITALHLWPIVRVIGHFNLPRMITTAGYRLGECMLTVLGRTYFGDYKVILAERPAGQ